MPSETTTQFDTENAFPWTSIETTIDSVTGETLSIRTVFDAGYEAIAQFEAGRLIREVTFGEQATLGFTFQITEYDENGLIKELSTTFANNTSVTEQFENGIQTARIERDGEFGEEGIFPWSFKLTSYDDNGQIIDRGTEFDNGVSDVTFFVDGVRDDRMQRDLQDAKPWQEINTNYNIDGVIEIRDTLFDNGITRFEEFESGVRLRTTHLDNVLGDGTPAFDGGAKAWQEIYTTFDIDGVIEFRDTVFDNGVTQLEEFESGVRLRTTQLDNVLGDGNPAFDGGAKAWQEIYTTFDIEGVIEMRETVFDNGVRRLEEFENGERSLTVQFDNMFDDGTPPFDGGAKAWETIVTQFDEDGQIFARGTDFDNGVSRSEVFENGQRIGLFEGDTENVFAWSQKEEAFDFDGNLLLSKTRFDDGRETNATYDDGVISQRTTEIAGQILKDESFSDGQRTLTITNDVFDLKAWNSQTRTFDDDGDLAALNTSFDDNSITLRVFEDDNLTAFVQVNGSQPGVNGSPSWGARLTEYDDAGDRSVSEYDNPFELPQTYIDELFI